MAVSKTTYQVRYFIFFNGTLYKPGELISLTAAEAEALMPCLNSLTPPPVHGTITGAANLGGIGIFSTLSGGNLEFKGLSAGTGITLTPTADSVAIAAPGATGQANTASNLGSGVGLFARKAGVNLEFRGITVSTGLSLSSDANNVEITLDRPLPAGGSANQLLQWSGSKWEAKTIEPGEINTASNIGGGAGLFATKNDKDLQFKSLVAGSNISIDESTTEITLNATGGGGASSASFTYHYSEPTANTSVDFTDAQVQNIAPQAYNLVFTLPNPTTAAATYDSFYFRFNSVNDKRFTVNTQNSTSPRVSIDDNSGIDFIFDHANSKWIHGSLISNNLHVTTLPTNESLIAEVTGSTVLLKNLIAGDNITFDTSNKYAIKIDATKGGRPYFPYIVRTPYSTIILSFSDVVIQRIAFPRPGQTVVLPDPTTAPAEKDGFYFRIENHSATRPFFVKTEKSGADNFTLKPFSGVNVVFNYKSKLWNWILFSDQYHISSDGTGISLLGAIDAKGKTPFNTNQKIKSIKTGTGIKIEDDTTSLTISQSKTATATANGDVAAKRFIGFGYEQADDGTNLHGSPIGTAVIGASITAAVDGADFELNEGPIVTVTAGDSFTEDDIYAISDPDGKAIPLSEDSQIPAGKTIKGKRTLNAGDDIELEIMTYPVGFYGKLIGDSPNAEKSLINWTLSQGVIAAFKGLKAGTNTQLVEDDDNITVNVTGAPLPTITTTVTAKGAINKNRFVNASNEQAGDGSDYFRAAIGDVCLGVASATVADGEKLVVDRSLYIQCEAGEPLAEGAAFKTNADGQAVNISNPKYDIVAGVVATGSSAANPGDIIKAIGIYLDTPIGGKIVEDDPASTGTQSILSPDSTQFYTALKKLEAGTGIAFEATDHNLKINTTGAGSPIPTIRDGCVVTRASSTKLSFSAGRVTVRDSSSGNLAVGNLAAMTKSLSSPFSTGNNGGLIIGSDAISNGTWYIWAIAKPSDNSFDYAASKNLDISGASHLPAGWTYKRFVWAVRVESGSIALYRPLGAINHWENDASIPPEYQSTSQKGDNFTCNVRGFDGLTIMGRILGFGGQQDAAPFYYVAPHDVTIQNSLDIKAFADGEAAWIGTASTQTGGRNMFSLMNEWWVPVVDSKVHMSAGFRVQYHKRCLQVKHLDLSPYLYDIMAT